METEENSATAGYESPSKGHCNLTKGSGVCITAKCEQNRGISLTLFRLGFFGVSWVWEGRGLQKPPSISPKVLTLSS